MRSLALTLSEAQRNRSTTWGGPPWRGLMVAASFLLALTWAPSPTVAQPSPTLVIPAYQTYIGVNGAGEQPPDVVVTAPDGRELARVTAQGTRNGDTWIVDLSPDAGVGAKLILAPGMRVEVRTVAGTVRAQVPPIVIRGDAEADRVSGSAPGFSGVAVFLRVDELWLAESAPEDPLILPVAQDGTFEAELGDQIDLRPGVWGEMAVQDAEGHVYTRPFAPPAAAVVWSGAFVQIRSDPDRDPVVRLTDDQGFETFRSADGIHVGGGVFAVTLFDLDNPGAGTALAEPGDRLHVDISGSQVLEAVLPSVYAGIHRDDDMSGSLVRGQTLADARLTLRYDPDGADGEPVRVGSGRSEGDGHFEIDADVPTTLAGTVTVMAADGGPVAHVTTGRVVYQAHALFGNELVGIAPGRGNVRVTLETPEGQELAAARVPTDGVGQFRVTLITRDGLAAEIAPGQIVRVVPDVGETIVSTVPMVTAQVEANGPTLRGRAPAGARLSAAAYAEEPNPFSNTVYEQPSVTLAGVADAQGAYALPCRGAACGMAYGRLTAETADRLLRLDWMAEPRPFIQVSLSTVSGQATAGTEIGIRTAGPDGAPLVLSGRSVPRITQLPAFTVSLRDAYPDGLPVGLAGVVEAGNEGGNVDAISFTVPELTWEPDTLTDSVSGTGPPLSVLVVAALPAPGDDTRYAVATNLVIPPSGRWRADFGNFDLRAGDGLEMFLAAPDHVLQWSIGGITGPEPSPSPSPPTATPTARSQVYLPAAHTSH